MKTAKQIIEQEYGTGRNFMTPKIISRGLLPDGAYEISEGDGFFHESIFGISVVRLNEDGTTERMTDECKVVYFLRDAIDYIKELKRSHKLEVQKQ